MAQFSDSKQTHLFAKNCSRKIALFQCSFWAFKEALTFLVIVLRLCVNLSLYIPHTWLCKSQPIWKSESKEREIRELERKTWTCNPVNFSLYWNYCHPRTYVNLPNLINIYLCVCDSVSVCFVQFWTQHKSYKIT